MEKEYIVTSDGNFVSAEELRHWGIKGMKWGIRRYQNKDGSLTPAGEKRRKKLEAEVEKLGGKKRSGESDDAAVQISKKKPASEMNDKELQDKVNRLRNEDAYNDLSKKLGYDGPKTELDAKIAQMEKQKKYLELQRDINNLTPKKVSLGKKVLDSIVNDVIAPAVKTAGKDYLTKYLSKAAADALGNTAKKEASKVSDTVKNATEKAKQQEANKQAKQQAKAEKKAAKKEAKESAKEAAKERTANKQDADDAGKYTVEGVGTSSRTNSNTSNKNKKGGVVDMDPWPALNAGTSTITTPSNTSSGKSYVSGYLNSPVGDLPSPNIAGYLPAPRDDV